MRTILPKTVAVGSRGSTTSTCKSASGFLTSDSLKVIVTDGMECIHDCISHNNIPTICHTSYFCVHPRYIIIVITYSDRK
jgi:hypothetical protein